MLAFQRQCALIARRKRQSCNFSKFCLVSNNDVNTSAIYLFETRISSYDMIYFLLFQLDEFVVRPFEWISVISTYYRFLLIIKWLIEYYVIEKPSQKQLPSVTITHLWYSILTLNNMEPPWWQLRMNITLKAQFSSFSDYPKNKLCRC